MTAHKPGDPTTLNRLYGRTQSRALRKGQQELVDDFLPKIAVPDSGEITARRLFGQDLPPEACCIAKILGSSKILR